ncbi:MAG: substrate-binding periplasmic protein [Desulfococcaceae bacterium]
MKKILLTGLSLAMVFIMAGGILAAETVTVVFDENVFPIQYIDENGKAAGLYPSLIKAVLEDISVKYELQAYPWKRAIYKMEKEGAGVGGMYWNEKRSKIYDYSKPMFTERLMLYVRKGEGFKFEKIEDLKGKTLGINLGWSYGTEFDSALEKGLFTGEPVKGNELNFRKLSNKRVDAIIDLEVAAAPMIKKLDMNDQVEKLPRPVTSIDTHIVFSKEFNKTDLLKKIDESMDKLRKNGTFDKIINEYLKP